MKYRSISWERVDEGESLPILTKDVTATTIIAGAIASRDFMPVHHDRDFANQQGAPDIFPNIVTIGGWVGKYLTDWSGPEADIRRMDIRVGSPCFPGNTLTFSGKVIRKYVDEDVRMLDVSCEATVSAGQHAQVAATLSIPGKGSAMPSAESRNAASVAVGLGVDVRRPRRGLGAGVDEEMIALVGIKGPPQRGPDAVNREMIRHWCEAMEDANPLYTDENYARACRYGGIIAPPQMVQAWTMGALWPDGQETRWRRQDLPRKTDSDPIETAYLKMNQAGYIGTFVVRTTMEFFRPLFPGDRVIRRIELTDVTTVKKTRIGDGYFITFEFRNTNESGALICQQTLTMLKYMPRHHPAVRPT